MTGIALLLLAAVASAYGAWTSLKCRPPIWSAALAALLFAVAGVLAVLASWVLGDGIVLPGFQLSPGLKAYYFQEMAWGNAPWVGRALLAVAPLAHILLVAVRRDRRALLLPLPATAIFLWLFLHVGAVADEREKVVRARGPGQVAYLTIVSRDGEARLILAAGEPFASFLKVLHVHETTGDLPALSSDEGEPLHLYWTNDGKGLVVRVHEQAEPAFAVDLQGNVTGALPAEAREWPVKPGLFVPGDVEHRFSTARKDVAKFVQEHKGLAPP